MSFGKISKKVDRTLLELTTNAFHYNRKVGYWLEIREYNLNLKEDLEFVRWIYNNE